MLASFPACAGSWPLRGSVSCSAACSCTFVCSFMYAIARPLVALDQTQASQQPACLCLEEWAGLARCRGPAGLAWLLLLVTHRSQFGLDTRVARVPTDPRFGLAWVICLRIHSPPLALPARLHFLAFARPQSPLDNPQHHVPAQGPEPARHARRLHGVDRHLCHRHGAPRPGPAQQAPRVPRAPDAHERRKGRDAPAPQGRGRQLAREHEHAHERSEGKSAKRRADTTQTMYTTHSAWHREGRRSPGRPRRATSGQLAVLHAALRCQRQCSMTRRPRARRAVSVPSPAAAAFRAQAPHNDDKLTPDRPPPAIPLYLCIFPLLISVFCDCPRASAGQHASCTWPAARRPDQVISGLEFSWSARWSGAGRLYAERATESGLERPRLALAMRQACVAAMRSAPTQETQERGRNVAGAKCAGADARCGLGRASCRACRDAASAASAARRTGTELTELVVSVSLVFGGAAALACSARRVPRTARAAGGEGKRQNAEGRSIAGPRRKTHNAKTVWRLHPLVRNAGTARQPRPRAKAKPYTVRL